MLKRINYVFIIITLFFGFITMVDAKESIVDFSKKGSLEVILHEEEEDTYVEGAEITIYQIADAYNEGIKFSFKYTEQFSGCEASLEDMTKDGLTEDIAKCIKEDSIGITEVTNEEGKVKFDELPLGLYFVKQTNKVKGYSNIEPFLVHTPTSIDNSWTYDIVATPKTNIYKEIDLTVKKVWNTNISKVPPMVEIELYKGEELIDTIELSEENEWTHTWLDIEKSDKYQVKEINIPKGYKVTYSKEGYEFTVTNTDTLANTGQLFYSIIILAVLGIVFILFGVIELKKGNHE